MTRIVTSHYRYKRPPRKRAKAVPIEGPAVLTISDKTRKRVEPLLPSHFGYATQMSGTATFWKRCGDATAEDG